MAGDTNQSATEAEFITTIEAGPLTEIEVFESADGAGVIVTAVALDETSAEPVPVGITLDPAGGAYIVTIATEEIVVPRDRSADEQAASTKNSKQIGPLRKLHELATKLEQETKGKARELAEKLRGKRTA